MSLDAEDIRNEKVKVLRSMKTVTLDDVVIGQYRSRSVGGKTLPGYLDDKTVPKGRCEVIGGCHGSCDQPALLCLPVPCFWRHTVTRASRSLCPTFSAVAMFIDNARWDGVPFLLKAGKALHSKRAEIRVQFRHVPGNLYKGKLGADLDNATNELVRSHSLCRYHAAIYVVNLGAGVACSSGSAFSCTRPD